MLNKKEIEEIKKLIQNGFDLNLISFELDIPIAQVKKYKKELETSKNRTHSKIEQMREKYKELYFKNCKVESTRPKPLSQEDIELIDKVIETIEEKIQQMDDLTRKGRRKVGIDILTELKKIEKYELPMAQTKKLYILMCSVKLRGLDIHPEDRIDYAIRKRQKVLATHFAMAVELEHYETEDIEELQKLDKKITQDIVSENPIPIGAIKKKISNKIGNIRQQQTINRIRNDISTSIISVITDLVNGNIDIQKANTIIDDEAKRRVENSPKTKFSLTETRKKTNLNANKNSN